MIRPAHVLDDVPGHRRTWCGIKPTPFFAYSQVVFYPSVVEITYCKNCKRTKRWKELLAARGLS